MNLNIFMIYYIVLPEITILSSPIQTFSDDAVVNLSSIKALLGNGRSTFFINGKPIFSNGPRSLPRNLTVFVVLDS